MSYSKESQTGRKWIETENGSKWQGKESDLQKQCEEYLTYFPNIAVIRIPDAAYRAIFASNLSAWIKRIISKYLKGLPDLILLRQVGAKTFALCIEVKTEKGKLSQGQKHFGSIVNVQVIRSFDDFVEAVKKFSET